MSTYPVYRPRGAFTRLLSWADDFMSTHAEAAAANAAQVAHAICRLVASSPPGSGLPAPRGDATRIATWLW